MGSRSSETSVAVNLTLTFQSDTTAERTVHVVTSLAGQGVETLYEGTPAFLSFPVNLPRTRQRLHLRSPWFGYSYVVLPSVNPSAPCRRAWLVPGDSAQLM